MAAEVLPEHLSAAQGGRAQDVMQAAVLAHVAPVLAQLVEEPAQDRKQTGSQALIVGLQVELGVDAIALERGY